MTGRPLWDDHPLPWYVAYLMHTLKYWIYLYNHLKVVPYFCYRYKIVFVFLGWYNW